MEIPQLRTPPVTSKRHPSHTTTTATSGPSAPFHTAFCDTALSLAEVLARVSQRLAPVWPLKNYVAVNPYLGMADMDWRTADRFLSTYRNSTLYMPLAHFQQLWKEGRLAATHLEAAIDEMLRDGIPGAAQLTLERIEKTLTTSNDHDAQLDHSTPPIRSFCGTIARWVDQYDGSNWNRLFREEIGKYCALHYDQGQATWTHPWAHLSLFAAWRAAQQFDRRLELEGLPGFPEFVGRLPASPVEALSFLLERLQIPVSSWESLLLGQAFDLPGWASWTKYQTLEADRRAKSCDDFAALLAIRLAYDTFLSHQVNFIPDWSALAEPAESAVMTDRSETDSLVLRHCLLRASEISHRQEILGQLNWKKPSELNSAPATATSSRSLARVVFCIDVRSERIRRAFETSSPQIKTSGFAGFFGIPMELVPWGEQQGIPHAPAPVVPQIRVTQGIQERNLSSPESSLLKSKATLRFRRKVWKLFQTSGSSSLGHIETAGFWYGWQLLLSTLGWSSTSSTPSAETEGLAPHHHLHLAPCVETSRGELLDEARQTQMALNLVRSLNLQEETGRFVVFCGHAATSQNNPLQAALDCGACCGHSGEANARYAARLLNHPQLRAALAQQGFALPDDLHFLAALHDTTTDEVTYFDLSSIPSTHLADFQQLVRCSKLASRWTRLERQPSLACNTSHQLLQRAQDWSEIRPEWGLAGNAAMLIGPRSISQTAHLDGRVFLHDYDASKDADGAILETIMTAPMVVAHWINMQYYASTVDNRNFGCGNKTIHNVTGHFGLLAGGGGDLLTGLPWQSLGRGNQLQHEPMRLQVIIVASRERIHQIVEKTPLLRDLISHDWLHLVALEEERFFRFTRRRAWLPLHIEPRIEPSTSKGLAMSPAPDRNSPARKRTRRPHDPSSTPQRPSRN